MKHLLTWLVVLGVLCLALSIAPTPAWAHFSGKKFCTDPGHGGSDSGAVGFGDYEKTFNLQIGNYINSHFAADGAYTKMTRSSDVYVSLQGRCDIANNWGATRFVSTHCNAFSDPSANGTETYCYTYGSSYSFDLRNKTNPELVSHMGTYNRGVKTADFYVLHYTSMPAILGEVAFITNSADNNKLSSDSYRHEAGHAYLHGMQLHYGQTTHTM